jgi:hypothetical protein
MVHRPTCGVCVQQRVLLYTCAHALQTLADAHGPYISCIMLGLDPLFISHFRQVNLASRNCGCERKRFVNTSPLEDLCTDGVGVPAHTPPTSERSPSINARKETGLHSDSCSSTFQGLSLECRTFQCACVHLECGGGSVHSPKSCRG